MSKIDAEMIPFDEFDELNSPRPAETDFDVVVEEALSRRGFLSGVLAFGTASFLMGTSVLTATPAQARGRFAFEGIPANGNDTVTIAKGFKWQTVVKWGDPLWSRGVAFDEATRGTGASQELAFGDNNDGMALFAAPGGKSVLAVNNEYVNRSIIHGNRASMVAETADDVRKSKAGHGVAIVEVRQEAGNWQIVQDSSFNRRITADTPVDLTGPAAGHDLLKTKADPSGTKALGTFNNCANGETPWGTYLTCEENFNGYFSSSDPTYKMPKEFKRYGVKSRDYGYGWAKFDERFDVSKHPNEPNRAGYVVEIDPIDPKSTPKKRTALGRFKHENAEVVVAANGHVVVYMGDDERGEFIYRYVSDGKFEKGGDTSELLNKGRLYVAKFNADGKGEWLALTPETTGMKSMAEICIHTRIAASAVKATTMDRPEWIASNPKKPELYCCLTNNKNRGRKPNAGGDATPVGGPNPREANKYGQIVRWRPVAGDHTAAGFEWDLFVLAGNPAVHTKPGDLKAGSKNVNAGNFFNSPDGLRFDNNGMLWIQTDGSYSNKGDFAGMGNNQMLVADTETGEIRRFLVGPQQCEITGSTFSKDRKTLFIGIQHPGERGTSNFPGGGDSVPRSCVIAITRDDGGIIG